MRFIPYALNKDELKMLDREIDNDDLSDVLKLIEGATTESLGQMQKEINLFLDEKDGESSGSKKEGSNPFLAIIGYYNKKSEKEETKKPKSAEVKGIRKDDWIEKTHLRNLAAENARDMAFTLFDVYKQGHGMVSYT